MMDGWMVGPSPTRCWLRPDADDDDDADANERNMRRHPPLPPPPPRPSSPLPSAPRQVSIVVAPVAFSGKNKKAKGRAGSEEGDERKQDDLSG